MGDLGLWLAVSKQLGYYVLLGLVVFALVYVVHRLTQKYLLRGIRFVIQKLPLKWKKIAVKGNVFRRASHLLPAICLVTVVPILFNNFPVFIDYFLRIGKSYIIFVSLLVFSEMITTFHEGYQTFQVSKQKPIKGLLQILKLLLFSLGFIVIISKLMDQSPGLLLGSLGALTAVLMLLFKDPLLGFVGGFQLAANDMVSVGDWIEMEKYGANGNVIDISITSVKVRNFDKTITTIPTYALTTESFKNWRGMFESGGRRIKRSILIDQQTIHFCSENFLKKFQDHPYLSSYIESLGNTPVTNLGLLREYITKYLENHERIHSTGMLFLVRHLEPTEHGLPLELYVFTKDTLWRKHEEIQAEVFEHIIAMMKEFKLSIFQSTVQINARDIGLLRASEEISV